MTSTYELLLPKVCRVVLSSAKWLPRLFFPQLGIVDFFKFKLGQCIFPQYMCIFYPNWMSLRGSKGQISQYNRPKYFKIFQIAKIKVSTYSAWTEMQKCPWWHLRLTYHYGQRPNKVKMKVFQIAKITMPTCWAWLDWTDMKRCPQWPLCPTYKIFNHF